MRHRELQVRAATLEREVVHLEEQQAEMLAAASANRPPATQAPPQPPPAHPHHHPGTTTAQVAPPPAHQQGAALTVDALNGFFLPTDVSGRRPNKRHSSHFRRRLRALLF